MADGKELEMNQCEACGKFKGAIAVYISPDRLPNKEDRLIDLCRLCAFELFYCWSQTLEEELREFDQEEWQPMERKPNRRIIFKIPSKNITLNQDLREMADEVCDKR
jgi:hypothetical protein